ncbi:hypothetical protein PMAYCL1PPCAC_08733 [Pristionchus mayeri]|uniref:BED-type domain-containing protein n=1 Tax=Pristionchus mayeri TaxID=1317129 RepID=A0AAN5C5S5_9BILA|nr:hypothetical protein PMAYCL1PPCAC_08733 [Pristionchus mayeri]
MAPPPSPAWNFFIPCEDDNKAKCQLCKKFIRFIKNTSPLIAHLRCRHPEVLKNEPENDYDEVEMIHCETQTEEIAPPELSPEKKMEYDMNLRLREMMALRLDDAVGDIHNRVTTNPIAQLVRALCESCMWLIRDWPGQKIDNHDSVRASRLDTLGRLRQLLRTRPPKHSELDSLILLLSDAMLTICEQWPGGDTDAPPIKASPQQTQQPLRAHHSQPIASSTTVTSTTVTSSVHIPPVYGSAGATCKPPAPKLPRMAAKPWTVDGFQQPSTSTSNSFPPSGQRPVWKTPRDMPQASNAGAPSVLWTFFTKSDEHGVHAARCSVCSKVVPRHNHGTSAMKNHLKVHHPAEFATLSMDSSTSSETSLASPQGVTKEVVEPVGEKGRAKEKALSNVSAIVAALNRDSIKPDISNSLLFDDTLVKEEEMDFDEPIDSLPLDQSIASDNDKPSASLQSMMTASAALRPLRGNSDIWAYFRKEDVGEEKHSFCKLCDWGRKMYNHGTNTMWSHLRRSHPLEYSNLKPYEYNPVIHGQLVTPFMAVLQNSAERNTVRTAPGASLPSDSTLDLLPRPSPGSGADLSKEE